MNYRHAFHAGNHADVLKHAVLSLCLLHLKRKPGAFTVLDTHAGCGLYDLSDEAAQRGGEWEEGVGRLWRWAEAPAALSPYLEALSALNPEGALQIYPGSPALIAQSLRAQDRLIACELHPDDFRTLKRRFARDRRTRIHHRDGWEGLNALLPFAERRGLILIDPPYEAGEDYRLGAEGVRAALQKFPQGTILWWRPLKDERVLARADETALAHAQADWLRLDLAVSAPVRDGPLKASSLLILNPPFTLNAAMAEAGPVLAARLAIGPGGGFSMRGG